MVRVLEKARLVPSLSSLNLMEHHQRSMVNIREAKPNVQRKLRKTKSTKSKVRFVQEPQLLWNQNSNDSMVSIAENIEREFNKRFSPTCRDNVLQQYQSKEM